MNKKGLLSALCLMVLLIAPACCWRKSCGPVCETASKCDDVCTETYCEPVIVHGEREITITKRCGSPKIQVEPCCNDMPICDVVNTATKKEAPAKNMSRKARNS